MSDSTVSFPRAIETRYKNCHFRSRLEARWAIFFDTCDLRWEYERECFTNGDKCYLPDFWMPDIETWVEIKPDLRPVDIEWGDWWPLDWPVPLDLEPRLVVLFGSPESYNGYLSHDRDYRWQQCPDCGQVNLEYDARCFRGNNHTADCVHWKPEWDNDRTGYYTDPNKDYSDTPGWGAGEGEYPGLYGWRVHDGIKAAMSHRFDRRAV